LKNTLKQNEAKFFSEVADFSTGYFLLVEKTLEGKIWHNQVWFGYDFLVKTMPKLIHPCNDSECLYQQKLQN
jgi:hypothetical protein